MQGLSKNQNFPHFFRNSSESIRVIASHQFHFPKHPVLPSTLFSNAEKMRKTNVFPSSFAQFLYGKMNRNYGFQILFSFIPNNLQSLS